MAARLQALARRLERDFLGGSIRLHILHHAREGEVFGVGLIEELRHHGYRLSPGTLYPILHALEKGRYLSSTVRIVDGRRRRSYVATATGRAALEASLARILELVREVFHGDRRFGVDLRDRHRRDGIGAAASARTKRRNAATAL